MSWSIFLCAQLAGTLDGLFDPQSPVNVLKTLPSRNGGNFLILFYSAWCGHCQRFKPEYEETALRAKMLHLDVIVAAINCATFSDACAEAKVPFFPWIALHKGDLMHEFKGEHKVLDIIAWVIKMLPGSSANITAATDPVSAKRGVARGATVRQIRHVSVPVRLPRLIPAHVMFHVYAARQHATSSGAHPRHYLGCSLLFDRGWKFQACGKQADKL